MCWPPCLPSLPPAPRGRQLPSEEVSWGLGTDTADSTHEGLGIVLLLPYVSWVTTHPFHLFHLSEPHFPHMESGNNNAWTGCTPEFQWESSKMVISLWCFAICKIPLGCSVSFSEKVRKACGKQQRVKWKGWHTPQTLGLYGCAASLRQPGRQCNWYELVYQLEVQVWSDLIISPTNNSRKHLLH